MMENYYFFCYYFYHLKIKQLIHKRTQVRHSVETNKKTKKQLSIKPLLEKNETFHKNLSQALIKINKKNPNFTIKAKLTLLPMILCTSSSGETGVLARSGLELLMLLERDRCKLLGRAVALDMVAYCMGIS